MLPHYLAPSSHAYRLGHRCRPRCLRRRTPQWRPHQPSRHRRSSSLPSLPSEEGEREPPLITTFARTTHRLHSLLVPPPQVPGYILAQTIGCFIAAWIIYTNYSEAIDHFEPNSGRTVFGPNSTASNFISIPAPGISLWSAFHDEFLGTALLVGGIFAFTNPALPGHALAFAIFFLVLAIANGVGAQTGDAINPAREFGPRLALATLGYPVKDLFSVSSRAMCVCCFSGG